MTDKKSARSVLEQWEQQAQKQHVDPKVTESFEKATQQGREQWEEAARKVQRTFAEPEK